MRVMAGSVAAAIVVTALVCLGLLAAPVHTHDGVSCGPVLAKVKPDPTQEREFGCGDLHYRRGDLVKATALVAGPLLVLVALGGSAAYVGLRRRPVAA